MLTVLMVATAAAGCAPDLVAGCSAPPDEPALLDELAKDPALSVTLPGAKRRDEPERREACHRTEAEVTLTTVWVDYDLARDTSPEEVRAAFDPVVSNAGWVAIPPPRQAPQGSYGVQYYCRDVLGRPSLLAVSWEGAKTIDEDTRVPAHLAVVIRGSADAECRS